MKMGEKIDLGPVAETLLIPLWARARDAGNKHSILNDTHARDIVAGIDYDFTKFETRYMENHQLVWSIRAYNFDLCVKKFLKNHKDPVVINIGAGLDTTFQRVDDGRVDWINLELPDVAELRKTLIPDSDREKTIARNVLDFDWVKEADPITKDRPLLFTAAGVLCYFEAADVEALFRRLAGTFPKAHVIFDAMSRFTVWVSNRAVLKGTGMNPSGLLRWHLKKASRLKKWVDSIEIVEEYPLFSSVPIKEDWSRKLIRDIRIAGKLRLYNMVHIRL